MNEERAKPAKALRIGDLVVVRKPPFEHAVVVKGLSEQRGSATIAATLFEETAESRARRERIVAERRAGLHPAHDARGRPTKRDRRMIRRLTGG